MTFSDEYAEFWRDPLFGRTPEQVAAREGERLAFAAEQALIMRQLQERHGFVRNETTMYAVMLAALDRIAALERKVGK